MSEWILAFYLAALAAPMKSVCPARDLARRDCRLKVANYNIRLLPETIAWNDGTWRTVDDMPLKGDGLTWEKATFEFINGWPILQLWIWDSGTGETSVQSLRWYVADAEKRHLTILAEGVVRRRRKSPEGKFINDPMEPHALKPLKSGGLEWTLRGQKKTIERVPHGV